MKKVIEIKDLSVSFTQNNELVRAVQKSNFFINEGECFSIVGESGSGKSVTCLLYTSPSPRDMRRSRMPSSA